MMRLLQGDVGSGKTVVALLAMLIAVEAGAQAALMAPTEILARQHLRHHRAACRGGRRAAGAAHRTRKGQKREGDAEGPGRRLIHLVVGTHALVQEEVAFDDLGLAVVDEQHRFGVHQRMALSSKGHAVDLLVMTATPIPRTLMLTAYGDIDVSRLTEKPAGPPADRHARAAAERHRRGDRRASAAQIATGGRVYWVCPLVEESEDIDLAAAEERCACCARASPDRSASLHGRMKGAERERDDGGVRRGDDSTSWSPPP